VTPGSRSPKTGLVLSGGGMRGAYEVGVVAGIIEVLSQHGRQGPYFDVFSGTSVGAINATYLAAHSHHPDYAIGELASIWRSLNLAEHARVRPLGLLTGGLKAKLQRLTSSEPLGNSLIDTRALEVLVRRSVDWDQLHKNIDQGLTSALLVAALHVVSGRTTIFCEHAPDAQIAPVHDERRTTSVERIAPAHVLASAAIPLLFPTRRVGQHYYCDGGLRFNTPIAPAIRAGAERLVVISVRYARTPREVAADEEADVGEGKDLSPVFLIGKLLDALLLDPVEYDLRVLERLNQVMEVLEEALPARDLERVQKVWIQHRGAPYRRLETLVFTPSRDLGQLAGQYIRESLDVDRVRPLLRYLIERAAKEDPNAEADWASFLLFEGGFAERVIEVGRMDAIAKAPAIIDFFLSKPRKLATG
jgi:NTE family protein